MEDEYRSYDLFIFTGHFGSGKTEVAANFAVGLSNYCENVNIVDLDIVNPFFRTTDFKNIINNEKIKIISSNYAGSNLEISSIPPNLPLVIAERKSKTILDVGGDDVGARILNGYKEYIFEQRYRMYCVVNIRRAETDSVEKIIKMISQIELASGIKVSALVNNTNLSNETNVEDLIAGNKIIGEVSQKLAVPIGFVCADKRIFEKMPNNIYNNNLIHSLRVSHPWDADETIEY